MKSVRIERILASSVFGLALALSGHAVQAQSTPKQVQAAIPEGSDNAPAVKPDEAKPTEQAQPTQAAPAQTQPAEAATQISSADQPIADKLRDTIRTSARILDRKAEKAGAESFYAARNYAPLWFTNGVANDRAKAAANYLATVEAVGLDPADYPVPDFKSLAGADAQAEAELRMTNSVLTYARHAQIGRIHYTRINSDIYFDLKAPEPADVLAKLADSKDIAALLDGYNPPHDQFKRLKAKLADLRKGVPQEEKKAEEKPEEKVRVAEGKTLKPGMKDPRVISLRERLKIAGDKTSELYDDAVRDAVKKFQNENQLGNDGNLGPMTVKALNGDTRKKEAVKLGDPIETIIVNMERWRWFPRDLGNPRVIVNVPDYTLALWNNDKIYWQTRIVAGQPGSHATPMTSAEMKFITVNPTWNVPPSIVEKEYLPALQEDPQALERIGLKVEQDKDGNVRIWQPPGAANALGRIRFNFPNKFLVYQHDTPDKHLFDKEKRAYSHGCMRVQYPLVYAEKLLSLELPNENYTEARIEKMFGGNEININFPKPLWVHLTYQTAFVDDAGKLQMREDVYGRDQRMIAILKGSERKVADIAIDRPANTSSKPVKLPVGTFGGGGWGGGSSFFDALFGGNRGFSRRSDNYPRYR